MNGKAAKTASRKNAQRLRPLTPSRAPAGSGQWRRIVLPGFLSLVVITVIVGWYLLQPQSRTRSASLARSEPQNTAAPERPIAPVESREARTTAESAEKKGGLAFRAGDYLRFKFRTARLLEVALSEDIAPQSGPASSEVDFELKGTLHLRVYEERDDHFVIGFELSDPKGELRSLQMGQVMKGKEIVAGMRGEVVAKVHRLGTIERLYFAASTTPMGRNYWRDLLALWQKSISSAASVGLGPPVTRATELGISRVPPPGTPSSMCRG